MICIICLYVPYIMNSDQYVQLVKLSIPAFYQKKNIYSKFQWKPLILEQFYALIPILKSDSRYGYPFQGYSAHYADFSVFYYGRMGFKRPNIFVTGRVSE